MRRPDLYRYPARMGIYLATASLFTSMYRISKRAARRKIKQMLKSGELTVFKKYSRKKPENTTT